MKDFNITPSDAQKQELIQVKYIQATDGSPDVDNLSIFDPQKPLSISDSNEDGQERLEYIKNVYGDGATPDADSAKCTSESKGL